jgi:hypothetical protein
MFGVGTSQSGGTAREGEMALAQREDLHVGDLGSAG